VTKQVKSRNTAGRETVIAWKTLAKHLSFNHAQEGDHDPTVERTNGALVHAETDQLVIFPVQRVKS